MASSVNTIAATKSTPKRRAVSAAGEKLKLKASGSRLLLGLSGVYCEGNVALEGPFRADSIAPLATLNTPNLGLRIAF